jgi:hypothetical protein
MPIGDTYLLGNQLRERSRRFARSPHLRVVKKILTSIQVREPSVGMRRTSELIAVNSYGHDQDAEIQRNIVPAPSLDGANSSANWSHGASCESLARAAERARRRGESLFP